MGSVVTALALALSSREVGSRPFYQYQLLDPVTKLPNGEVIQLAKSPAELTKQADPYAELEMRVLASMPPEQRAQVLALGGAWEAYRESGRDIHAEVAAALFDGPPKDAQEAKARRDAARAVGFSALYGSNRPLAKV